MSSAIHHFAFTVSDLEASAAFYERHFGLRELSRNDHSGPEISEALAVVNADLTTLMLAGENCILELVAYRDPAGAGYDRRNSDVGAPHVCFEVDDVVASYEEMVADGVDIVIEPREFGADARYFFARDPDGITVEVVTLGADAPRPPLLSRRK